MLTVLDSKDIVNVWVIKSGTDRLDQYYLYWSWVSGVPSTVEDEQSGRIGRPHAARQKRTSYFLSLR